MRSGALDKYILRYYEKKNDVTWPLKGLELLPLS